MILTVTLNAAIDRTVAVPSFRQGNRHRAVEASTVAGGKGVNVARALKLLGRPVIATGLAGGPTGARLMERLAEESILTDFTWIGGESRTNLAVIAQHLQKIVATSPGNPVVIFALLATTTGLLFKIAAVPFP